jgi:hypothetical protein
MATRRVLAALIGLSCAAHADPAEEKQPEPKHFGKLAAVVTTGAIYSTFGVYAYFAWFYEKPQVPFYVISDFRDEGPFALYSYAGGADKWGHAWSNYVLTRGTTELLVGGGWDKFDSSLAAAGLDLAWFTLSELKDGVTVGFETGDETMNVAGAALGVVMENVPALDRLFDFRLAYLPSPVYLHLAAKEPFHHNGGLDIGQDYTGQSYMLALHLGALPHVTESPWSYWTKYADLVVGFETRHYSPPEEHQTFFAYQTFYLGVALNVQALLNGRGTARAIGRGITEVYSLPATTWRFAEVHRYDYAMPPPQGVASP